MEIQKQNFANKIDTGFQVAPNSQKIDGEEANSNRVKAVIRHFSFLDKY